MRPGPRSLDALLLLLWVLAAPVHAEDRQAVNPEPGSEKRETSPLSDGTPPAQTAWHYGAYLDLSDALDFNFPENHRFRSRTTTPRTNELAPNMALGYLRKDITGQSRWGLELAVQGGYDSKEFAFGQDRPLVGGADTLRHFSRANVSYLAPVGRGLTLTAGLFNSFIGYESLYAKDNANYTRSWIADNSPYMMFGLGARQPVNDDLTVGVYVINGYWHLAHPNDLPSYGAQLAWKPTSRLSVIENLYYGPDQANTSIEFWRLFSDSIVEWKSDALTVAFSYDFGTENIAGRPGRPRAFWTGGAFFTRWQIAGPWSVAVRPEVYWDRNARQTGFEQFVKAMTTTLEYRVPFSATNTVLRLEHRYDDSTGVEGGFFKRGDTSPGVPGLTQAQHLLLFAAMWTFDSP